MVTRCRAVEVRFHGELNDFLTRRAAAAGLAIRHVLDGPAAVKDTIEALGVPHVEVDVIEVEGVVVGFSHRLYGGERIEVYPGGFRPDLPRSFHLLPDPPEVARFIVDIHLGRLARYLRLLGFDCLYRNDYTDSQIAQCASIEDRIVLTRDTGLLKRNEVRRGRWVRAIHAPQQLAEVVHAFHLHETARPFSRCSECNAPVCAVDASTILSSVPPGTHTCYKEFYRCSVCGKVFWEGSHVASIRKLFSEVGL